MECQRFPSSKQQITGVLSLCTDSLESGFVIQHTNTVHSIPVQQKQAVSYFKPSDVRMCNMSLIAIARIIFAWKNLELDEC